MKRTFKEWLRKIKKGYLNRLRNSEDTIRFCHLYGLGTCLGGVIIDVIREGWNTTKVLVICGFWFIMIAIQILILCPLFFQKRNH